MNSNWPFGIDPTVRQNIQDTDGTVVGTCYYIAPEALLAAGWTLAELKVASEREGTVEGWESPYD